jgi:integrase
LRLARRLQTRLGLDGPKHDLDGKLVLDRSGRPQRHFTPHSLRHAAASLFIDQGWSPKRVQTAMGHSSIKLTFDVYGKPFADRNGADQGAAMAALAESEGR